MLSPRVLSSRLQCSPRNVFLVCTWPLHRRERLLLSLHGPKPHGCPAFVVISLLPMMVPTSALRFLELSSTVELTENWELLDEAIFAARYTVP